MSFFDGEGIAVSGEADGGSHVLRESEFAEVLLRVGEAGDGAGDSAGLVADERHSGDDVAFCVEVHVAGGCGRSLFAVVEEVGFAMLVADEHEAAAADISGCGVHDRERKAHGYGSVYCVAALFQDGYAGIGGIVMNADDHGVGCAGRLEVRLLGFAPRGGKREGGEQKQGAEAGNRLRGPRSRIESDQK